MSKYLFGWLTKGRCDVTGLDVATAIAWLFFGLALFIGYINFDNWRKNR